MYAVGVLEFVDIDVSEPPAVFGQYVGELAEKLFRFQQQVVEIHRIALFELTFVCGVNGCHGSGVTYESLDFFVILFGRKRSGLCCGNVPEVVTLFLRVGTVHSVAHSLYHTFALHFGVNGEVGVVTQFVPVDAENFGAHRVKSACPHADGTAKSSFDALFHLVGGLVRKSDCENVVRVDAAFHKIADARGKNTRFSAARPRYDQNRTFGVECGGRLHFVESVDVLHDNIITQSAGKDNF